MPELRKATLLEIDNDNQPRAGRQPVPVQFNPSSLRLQFSNQSEGGRQPGRQARQYTGSGSTTLSVDLVFDTADEGSTAVPRSVLERTSEVEYFMKPQGSGRRNQAPPRLRFQWGNLIVDGVMESLSVDLDHFAHDGTPLRAKASLSVKGQNPEYQFNQAGPGANAAVGATPSQAAAATAAMPGAGGGLGGALAGALGGINAALGAAGQVMAALDGESLAQLAVRAGLDPTAWRALAGGVGNPLSLQAGAEIDLSAATGVSLGLGATAGVQAGAAPSTAARVGLQTPPAQASSTGAALQQGYALSGAGGVGAALETVKADAGATAAAQARQAFGGTGGSATGVGSAGGAAPAPPASDPLSTAAATPGERHRVFSLRADPRAATYGRSVPLRDRVQIGHDERANLLSGQARVKHAGSGLPSSSGDPGVPAWVALPQAAGSASRPVHARGCRCGCGR